MPANWSHFFAVKSVFFCEVLLSSGSNIEPPGSLNYSVCMFNFKKINYLLCLDKFSSKSPVYEKKLAIIGSYVSLYCTQKAETG